MCSGENDVSQRNLVGVEHWVSIRKVVGSIPTVARHIFQSAQSGHTLRGTPQTSYTPEKITQDMMKVMTFKFQSALSCSR